MARARRASQETPETPPSGSPKSATIPDDDLSRALTVANAETDQTLPHLGIVGDTYTIVVSGKDTGGQYTMIDMLVPPGGGPGPHRHDFEEMFTVIEGTIELTFRGTMVVATAGTTVSVPANAPHSFHNSALTPARLLCVCTPAGQDEFFAQVGVRLPSRTATPPVMDYAAMAAFLEKAGALAPKFRTELLKP